MSDTPTHPTDLRSYFAANAPDKIPEWFKPDMDHLQFPAELANLPKFKTVEEANANPDLSAWKKKKAQVELQREECRYFMWRWHYADQMIEARKAARAERAQQRATGTINTSLFTG